MRGRVRDPQEGTRDWSDDASDTSRLPGLIGWRRRSIDPEVRDRRRGDAGRGGEVIGNRGEALRDADEASSSGVDEKRDRQVLAPENQPERLPASLIRVTEVDKLF